MTGVTVTVNVCSKASPEEEACVQELSVLRLEQVDSTVEEAKFPELQYSCGYMLNNNKQMLVVTQCRHIVMQELENGVAPGEPEVHCLILILHAVAS